MTPYYDLTDDWELIVASFQTQYGIRLAKELDDMKWKEFATYLGGLDGDTPLGRIVAIRSENDPKRVKEMTPEQKRVRTEWRRRQFEKRPPKDTTSVYLDLQRALQSMAGYEKS